MDEKLVACLRALESEATVVRGTAPSQPGKSGVGRNEPDVTGNGEPRSAGTFKSRRTPLPWPAERKFRILSIDGGGIRGLLPLSVLAAVERELIGGRSVADYFDLIAGTSTGGVIALGLAHGKTAAELLELYSTRGGEVFPAPNALTRATSSLTDYFCHKYDEQALEALLDDILGQSLLAEARVRLCIPSFEGEHGEVFVFKTAHHPDYKLDWRWQMKAVARATSAAPTFFRPLREGGWRLVDGGVWANNPIMVGLVDALACYTVARDNIDILSLGCMDDRFTVTEEMESGGVWHWRKAIYAAMSLASQNAIGQAGLLIGHDKILRLDAVMPSPRIELDDCDRSLRALPELGEHLFAANIERLRVQFFTIPAPPFLTLYSPLSPP